MKILDVEDENPERVRRRIAVTTVLPKGLNHTFLEFDSNKWSVSQAGHRYILYKTR